MLVHDLQMRRSHLRTEGIPSKTRRFLGLRCKHESLLLQTLLASWIPRQQKLTERLRFVKQHHQKVKVKSEKEDRRSLYQIKKE